VEVSLPAPGVLLETAERLGQLPRLGDAVRTRVAVDVAASPSRRWCS
jgi:hypothetical protein